MPPNLSSRQQAQLAFLAQLPPKFQKMHSLIEQMSSPRADESIVRGFGRLLDEIRGKASGLNLNRVADTAGLMGMMLRRGGGLQSKVRGLRDLFTSLKSNYDAAVRMASTPEELADSDPSG